MVDSIEPLVSIIVPVYNTSEYLSRCLDSIVGQKYGNMQIIVIDDCSSDGSAEICESYAKFDPRITVLRNQRNEGQSCSRNRALEIAEGDYIAFIDSDDYADPAMISRMMSVALKEDADLVCCGHYEIFGSNISMTPWAENLAIYDSEGIIHSIYDPKQNDQTSVIWGKLFKRCLWDEIRFPEGQIVEDTAMRLPLLSECRRIVVIPDCLYFYQRREGSTTWPWNRDFFLSYVDVIMREAEFIENRFPELRHEAYKAVIAAIIWGFNKSKDAGLVLSSDERKSLFDIFSEYTRKLANSLDRTMSESALLKDVNQDA